MFEKVCTVIAQQMNLQESSITLQTDLLKELNIDSLDLVELVCTFEMEFNIEVQEKDMRTFTTVGDVVKYLEAEC